MQISRIPSQFIKIISAVLLLIALPVSANMYGVFQLGAVDGQDDLSREDGAGYKLGIGYEFHRQWYVEFGYQKLADGDTGTLPASLEQVESYRGAMQADALYVGFLGKASSRDGELFYRLGVLKTDVKGEAVIADGESCSMGAGSSFMVADQSYTYCAYDEAGVAASVGLGYDYFVGTNLLIRFEAEHVRGTDGLEVNAAYIGVRYNFN